VVFDPQLGGEGVVMPGSAPGQLCGRDLPGFDDGRKTYADAGVEW